MRHYAPYGEPWGEQGTAQTPFGFTGEPTDQNGLVHLRARYYNPMLGVFPNLDPLEGSLMQAQSLNRFAYVQGNPANLIDPDGKSPYRQEDCADKNDIRELLLSGLSDDPASDSRFQQNSCSGPYPFGCYNNGQPIPYAIVQGFAQAGYGGGVSNNCPAWVGTAYSDHHCGIDMVSYTDVGFLWEYNDGKMQVEVSKGGISGHYPYNWNTGKIEGSETLGTGEASCVTVEDVTSGRVKFKYKGAANSRFNSSGGNETIGRKVFAVQGGKVTSYDSDSYTLKVNIGIRNGRNALEMQYTHLRECEGQLPQSLVGKTINQGQFLGCYAQVGRTQQAHLHILYKQVQPDGTPLDPTALCHPEDAYLNPLNPFTECEGPSPSNRPYHMWISRSWGRFPEHIRNYGYTAVIDRFSEWVEQPRR